MKTLLFFFHIPFLTIHILLYLCSKNRSIINVDIKKTKYNPLSSLPFKRIFSSLFLKLLYHLTYNRYFRTIFYYRIGQISKIVSWLYPGERTFVIHTQNIGEGFYAAHPFATILNAKKIGSNFSCRQSTTVGNKIDGRNDLRPTIGDNVILGANTVIIGNITIGNNVIIGAGSVVVKDIPDGSVAVGNPANVIAMNKSI